jgi:type IV pilus assembly protein PilE
MVYLARKSTRAGFTLIELMVTMAIIAVLAAFALPSYNDYVKRGMIPEATNALSDARVKLEQYFQDNAAHSYSGFASCPASTQHFTISCGTPTATTYTVSATGTGTMSGFGYTLDQSNVRATTGTSWGKTSTSCWVTRSDGSC